MPSACQPSKKSGASSVQRRYFSTADSSSPSARSPFASSNSSSTSGFMRGRLDLAGLDIRRLMPGAQPLLENAVPLVAGEALGEHLLLLGELDFVDRQLAVEVNDHAAAFCGHKLAQMPIAKVG